MNKPLTLLSLIFLSSIAHAALSARDMMVKNEDSRKISEFQAKAKLTIGNSTGGNPKIKDFTLWRKIQKDGVHNSTLTRFHTPAEVRDEGILILENASGKNDVLLYLPNFKKTRRVESQQQSGSLMGSVFSYSEIATPHADDYQYKTLGSEKCVGDAKLTCSKIEGIPSNEEIKERTKYSKIIMWVRPDNFMVEKVEYYQLDGKLWKVLNSTETKMVDTKNNKWLSHSLHIVNQLTQDFTTLQFSNVKVNSGIPDSTFTQQNLQKVK